MKKILAIDDQQLVLLSLEKHLSDIGYTIKCASDGQSGLELFDSFKPDIVIVDINMDGMSGLEVIENIRQEKKSDVKILVMSGNTNEDTIVDGFDLGIDDYMKKPLSLNEISARIARIFGIKSKKKLDNSSKGQIIIGKTKSAKKIVNARKLF
ncbi:response regulator transcription factor [Aquimarina algiphila]|uniref:response regulator transcription factor n=1 Tax=Aquimarina algiphila TaxID=2047982 RepID=UPI00232D8289|nr:response regulator transcription factor [Aquimarina algiphila]